MFTLRKAYIADCKLINKLALEVFPATYRDIISQAQIDFMMNLDVLT